MREIDAKRLKMELLKVQAAKAELEFKIEERKLEISRIEEHIKIQAEKEQELLEKISKQ